MLSKLSVKTGTPGANELDVPYLSTLSLLLYTLSLTPIPFTCQMKMRFEYWLATYWGPERLSCKVLSAPYTVEGARYQQKIEIQGPANLEMAPHLSSMVFLVSQMILGAREFMLPTILIWNSRDCAECRCLCVPTRNSLQSSWVFVGTCTSPRVTRSCTIGSFAIADLMGVPFPKGWKTLEGEGSTGKTHRRTAAAR